MDNIDKQALEKKKLNAPDQKSALIVDNLNQWPRKSLTDKFVKRVQHSLSFALFYV